MIRRLLYWLRTLEKLVCLIFWLIVFVLLQAGWQQVAAEKRFLTGSSDNGL